MSKRTHGSPETPAGAEVAAETRAAETRSAEAERLSQLRDKSLSDSTWATYLSAWQRWATWAVANDRPVLPADPHDLGAWANASVYPPTTDTAAAHGLEHTQDTSTAGTTAARARRTPSAPARLSNTTRGISASTLTTWMAAVAFVHRRAGHPSPLEDPALKSVLRGLRRDMVTTATPPRPAPALLTEHVERIVTAIDSSPTRGQSLLEVRDRALVLLAFTSAMRASELAALNVDDLEPDAAGLIVRVRSSKTDQEGAGAFIAIPWARRAHLCPVRAIDTWLDRLRQQLAVQDHDYTPSTGDSPRTDAAGRYSLPARRGLVADLHGAVLRSLFHNGRVGNTTTPDPHQARMARLAITKTITARARAAGLQAPDTSGRYYSAHSTRAGFATQAADNGVAERDIMNHGRWKSVAVARSYIRRGELFDDSNAAGHLGL